MGPQVTPIAPRPCLICRRSAQNSFQFKKGNGSSCAASLCTIFGLASDHPFKAVYERSLYCDVCFKEVQEADVALGKLQLLKQILFRFQNKIYNRLGENYFKIKNVESKAITYAEFEKGGDSLRHKKFNYEDIVKIVYEKLDQESDLWERFSSEGKPALDPEGIVDAATHRQTDDNICSPPDALERTEFSHDDTMDDDWAASADCNNHNDSLTDPLAVDLPSSQPEQEQISFSNVPANFDESEKIYCTYDPENCKRNFYDDYNLQIHIKSFHMGITRPHECSMCSKTFVDEDHLKKNHVRVHLSAGVKDSMCEQCGKEFAGKDLLRRHMLRVHEEQSQLTCGICSAKLETREEFEEHEALHRAKESPFACVYCPRILPNSTALRTHSREHFKNMFACSICSRLYANENSLKVHMRKHSLTARFQCDQCGYSTTSASMLKSHMISHSSIRSYTCEECGASYKHEKNLTAHRRLHSDEKPFSCRICNQSFKDKRYLQRHEESHSLQANYKCGTCPKEFKVRESLKRHMRIHREGYKRTKKQRPRKSPRSRNPQKVGRNSSEVIKAERDDEEDGSDNAELPSRRVLLVNKCPGPTRMSTRARKRTPSLSSTTSYDSYEDSAEEILPGYSQSGLTQTEELPTTVVSVNQVESKQEGMINFISLQ